MTRTASNQPMAHTVKAQCTATATTTGNRCLLPPVLGATVCFKHGAGAPQVRAKAARNVAEAKARAQMARMGLPDPVKISSTEAMIWMVSAKYAEVCWLREIVSGIDRDALVWGVTREKASKAPSSPADGTEPDPGTQQPPGTVLAPEMTREARTNIWWVMLRTGEDQLVRYAAAARSAGIDDQLVDLAKQKGQMLGAFLDGLMAAMFTALVGAGVTRDDFPAVWAATISELFPKHFRALGGAGAA